MKNTTKTERDSPSTLLRASFLAHLEELRRRILASLLFFLFSSCLAFWQGKRLLFLVKKPAADILPTLVFIAPTEAFGAYLRLSLLAGFILSFPFILYEIWTFVSPAIPSSARRRAGGWFFSALFLFAAGILFSYAIAFPFALAFLIAFGRDIAVPVITIGKYLSFFGAVILTGGIIFEIPVIMAVVTEAGFAGHVFFVKQRQYALLAILVISAVITPTQDIINMLVFAVPMILLYEVGIVISRIIELRRK